MQYPVAPIPTPAESPSLYVPPVEQEYRFQVGDTLAVRSYYDPQFNQDAVVRPDGRISLLLVGDVKVVDMTPAGLRDALVKVYRRVVDTPDIVVSLTKSAGLAVYLGGEVRQPSVQRLDGSLTVLQAITAAGGLLPSANVNQVLLLRRKPDNQLQVYKIDLDKVLRNEAPDVFVQRFDVVYVPKSQIANVGQFVEQYINAIVPRSVMFSFSWLQYRNGMPVQVVNP